MKGWSELKEAFWVSLESEPAEQASRMAALASIDPELPGRLEALLAADARGESLQHLFGSETVLTVRPARIGTYDIIDVLGIGGMGEVYRARDSRLQRDVAIKVLPSDMTNDPERLARFEREAQVLASLNHPHIAQVYGLDDSGSMPALVMELVEGPTLASVIANYQNAPLTLVRALAIARQIADGLEAAHEKSIVHRDLKPGNLALTPKGDVKILDFGVAKSPDTAVRPAARPSGATDVGVVIGTPAYMSPEQARGLPVDSRTDIWAFGCVLYELLTGRQPFSGITPTDTLVAVLERDPDMRMLPTDTPAGVRSLLHRCFEKDPERRLADIAEARLSIDDALNLPDHTSWQFSPTRATEPAEVSGLSSPAGIFRGPFHGTRLWATAVGVIVLALAAVLLWKSRATPTQSAAAPAMTIVPLTTLSGDEYSPAFSPDGEQIAFSWNGENEDNFDLYIKLVGSAAVRRLTTHPEFDGDPSWSPDGKQIAFTRWRMAGGCRLYVLSLLGGLEQEFGEFAVNEADPARYSSTAWSPDANYVAAAGTPLPQSGPRSVPGIYLLPVTRGVPRLIAPAETGMMHFSPAFSRDARHLSYVSCKGQFSCDVFAIDLDVNLAPTTPARRLTSQTYPRIGKVAWSPDGRSIIYDGEVVPGSNHLWRVASDGGSQPERLEAAGFARLPATASAGNRVAFTHWRFDVDINRFEPDGPGQALLTSTFVDMNPRFSPDGLRIAFSSGRTAETPEIWVAAADGREPHQLTHGPGIWQTCPHWSPDGRQIVFESIQGDRHQLWVIKADGGAPRQLTTDARDQRCPTWSRDGQWIYFTSDDGSGRAARRMPATGGPSTRVTTEGTGEAVWESVDGSRLFYTMGDALWSVPAAGGTPRQVLACAKGAAIAVGASGIYYATCNFRFELDTTLHVIDPDTQHDRVVGTLTDYWFNLEVSPDEKTILYSKASNRGLHKRFSIGSDLMLIENFR